MNKIFKNKYFKVLLIIICIAIVFYIVRTISNKKLENESRNYLSEKYNIPKNDLILKKVVPQHNKRMCSDGECIGTVKQVIPAYVIFKYKDQDITVCEEDDDYLYDKLFNGVRDYYANILGMDSSNVYVFVNKYDYMRYLCKNDLKQINSTNILDFIQETDYIKISLSKTGNENYNIKYYSSKLMHNEQIDVSHYKLIVKDDTGYDAWDRENNAKLTVFKRYTISGEY